MHIHVLTVDKNTEVKLLAQAIVLFKTCNLITIYDKTIIIHLQNFNVLQTFMPVHTHTHTHTHTHHRY
jgi:hypothetical protein